MYEWAGDVPLSQLCLEATRVSSVWEAFQLPGTSAGSYSHLGRAVQTQQIRERATRDVLVRGVLLKCDLPTAVRDRVVFWLREVEVFVPIRASTVHCMYTLPPSLWLRMTINAHLAHDFVVHDPNNVVVRAEMCTSDGQAWAFARAPGNVLKCPLFSLPDESPLPLGALLFHDVLIRTVCNGENIGNVRISYKCVWIEQKDLLLIARNGVRNINANREWCVRAGVFITSEYDQ